MDVTEAQKIVSDCSELILKIKDERQSILVKQVEQNKAYDRLKAELGQALVMALVEPAPDAKSKIKDLRKQLTEISEFLDDLPVILKGLDDVEAQQRQLKERPQAEIRADSERRRSVELNFNLQKKLLTLVGESEQFRHLPSWERAVRQFKQNALSLDQEASADAFIRSLKA